ncbi:prolactin receptor [Genypterus blacodes]|uniref:prolactin receptor n=1 Tax=Genypterus blacodes TaxID=154954 RepID=UPI003F768ACE
MTFVDFTDVVTTTTRPHIYFCRSPNMEDFTCWWHPLANVTDREEVTYILTYSKEYGPKHVCPDYVTAGPNSCHFDSSHTSIWKIYCMNVTAVTARGNYMSQEHCLDVADIVQTEAPVNLTYELRDAGGHEMGHNTLLSWMYPVPSDLQYGWITLVYELQYRRVAEPDNWKVKQPLRESHVELLGLPVGDYVIRVRCRSHNYGLWSEWSSTLLMSVPATPTAGKLLVLILVTGIGVVTLLTIVFRIMSQSKRVKHYFLPPIPKPRIIGIDLLLLKKGNIDDINRHFSSFHSYSPPKYTEEVWNQVSADDVCLNPPKDDSMDPTDRPMVLRNPPPAATNHAHSTHDVASYVQSLPPYCAFPTEASATCQDAPLASALPIIVSLPGTDYSMMGHPVLPVQPPESVSAARPPQDFYTCVQLMNESGEVHLVPCLPPPPAYSPSHLMVPSEIGKREEMEEEVGGSKKNVVLKEGREEEERSEDAVPLLPVDNKC